MVKCALVMAPFSRSRSRNSSIKKLCAANCKAASWSSTSRKYSSLKVKIAEGSIPTITVSSESTPLIRATVLWAVALASFRKPLEIYERPLSAFLRSWTSYPKRNKSWWASRPIAPSRYSVNSSINNNTFCGCVAWMSFWGRIGLNRSKGGKSLHWATPKLLFNGLAVNLRALLYNQGHREAAFRTLVLCAKSFVRRLLPFCCWYWYSNSALSVATSTLLGHSLAQALQLIHKSKTSFNSWWSKRFDFWDVVRNSLNALARARVVSFSFLVAR